MELTPTPDPANARIQERTAIVKVIGVQPGVGRFNNPYIRLDLLDVPFPVYFRGRYLKAIGDGRQFIGRWIKISIWHENHDPSYYNSAHFLDFAEEPQVMSLTPTPEQAAIIDAAEGDENLMVKALAGTGKTKTLEMLTPRLGLRGTRPRSILPLAFNVKIRDELKARLPVSVNGAPVKVMTLNGLGHGAWWSWVKRDLSVDTRKSTQILKSLTQAQGIRLDKEEFGAVNDLVAAAKSIGWVPDGKFLMRPKTILHADDEAGIEALFDWAEVEYRQDLEVLARACMIESINAVFNHGQLDFNDQLYMPIVFNAPFPKHDTVMVDEAQDLSMLNHIMIERSCHRRLIAVGDENQAIYAFRGAESDSMRLLEESRPFKVLPLTVTFRCAKAIVERQQAYVPDYTAADSNPEGVVEDWRQSKLDVGNEELNRAVWGNAMIPNHSAIICRNNAPLFSLAFSLLRQGRGVKMLGNDIGRSLERGLDNACKGFAPSTPQASILEALSRYFTREIAKAKTDRRKASLEDRWDCLKTIVENSNTLGDARRTCHKLFENQDAVVTLSSGHKSKGLEWDTVIHLSPWLIPSKYATTAEALRQEHNLRYVIETRPKTRLILANLEDFQ